mmetsp:Transcript_96827/g.312701  ORF Transcript_96827/g.312701 Transcript_96827/m.312701 type:complete len:226 (+) Transcript_96827:1790-2467(+)
MTSSNSRTQGTQPCTSRDRKCHSSWGLALWTPAKQSALPSRLSKYSSQVRCGTHTLRKSLPGFSRCRFNLARPAASPPATSSQNLASSLGWKSNRARFMRSRRSGSARLQRRTATSSSGASSGKRPLPCSRRAQEHASSTAAWTPWSSEPCCASLPTTLRRSCCGRCFPSRKSVRVSGSCKAPTTAREEPSAFSDFRKSGLPIRASMAMLPQSAYAWLQKTTFMP